MLLLILYNKMILYMCIVVIGVIFTTILSLSVGLNFLSVTDGEILITIIYTFLALFVIDALVAILVRLLPKKWINPFNKIYNAKPWETKLYLKLKIRSWKDKIPETGKALTGFGKDKILDMNDNQYIYKFMEETVYAEVMHVISAVLSIFVIFINLKLWYIVGLPMAVVNFVIQILPVMVQRYNRPKLKLLYDRNEKKSQQDKKIDEISKK